MSIPVYIALLHYPVVNRNGTVVTTAVTNMDIHDISRSGKTFGVSGFFIVTPIEDQHELINRILAHWRSDSARSYNKDRFEAVSLVRLAWSFDEVKAAIKAECGKEPEVVLTDAKQLPNSISCAKYRLELVGRLCSGNFDKPLVLVFGTGWGVSELFYPMVDRVLEPILGPGGEEGYNHLSVRAAVAIILDRLFSWNR
ncbi:MAG: RNA methyltransferase [Bdellovibrionota bacterium]